jgi:hypothetical protein
MNEIEMYKDKSNQAQIEVRFENELRVSLKTLSG